MPDRENPRPGHKPEAVPLDAPTEYHFPTTQEDLMPWSQAVDQLARSRNYWLATTRPDGRPHVTPFWGAWLDDAFYFQGVPTSRWARNIATNPAVSLHLESADNVVIVDGVVEYLVTDANLGARLIEAWKSKYGPLGPIEPKPATDGLYRLRPRAARAWSENHQDAARWTFSAA